MKSQISQRKGTKRFFYHYYKAESQKQGRNVMTLHFDGVCHMIHNIVLFTPLESHAQKRQPRCIMRGFTSEVKFTTNKKTNEITAIVLH